MGDTLYETLEDENPVPMPPPEEGDGGGNEGGAGSGKVNPQVIDALTIGTVNTIAAAASNAMANLYQHQINHSRRLDSMAEAYLGKILERMASDDPVETIAISKLFKGEADSSINSLLSQLSASQQGAKIAQSTPGDVSSELTKVGAAVSSLQGQIGGLVGILQQMLGTTGGVQMAPMVLSKGVNKKLPPPEVPEENKVEDVPWVGKYPTVTIKYS